MKFLCKFRHKWKRENYQMTYPWFEPGRNSFLSGTQNKDSRTCLRCGKVELSRVDWTGGEFWVDPPGKPTLQDLV